MTSRRLSAHVTPWLGVAGCVAFQPMGQLTAPTGAMQTRVMPSAPTAVAKPLGHIPALGARVELLAPLVLGRRA